MAIAHWKDLCSDASDPVVVGSFLARVLGRELQRLDDGDVRLSGERPEEAVWVDRVPEPRTGKNRVHLDLVGDVESVLAAGAHVVAEHPGWTVVADAEGDEHCVFPDRAQPTALVTDAADAGAVAAWWADVLGAELRPGPDGVRRWLAVPGLPFDVWKFVAVPEPKSVKNRMHWDLVCNDVPALVARGATVQRAPDDEISWHVLTDPEGNEFCAFASA